MTSYKTTKQWMQDVYYGVNPRPHSEKAYQRNDPEPPTATVPTFVGPKGVVVVMDTSLRNKHPFRAGDFSVVDGNGRKLHTGKVQQPGVALVSGLKPGSKVFIQPRTMGTMAKILTPGQIVGAGHEYPPPRA